MTKKNGTIVERRSVMVPIRLTVSEKEALKKLAAEAGVSQSDWLRKKALGVKPLHRKPSPEKELLLRFLAAFGKVGSNLNQLQRSINRKQNSEDFELPLAYIKQLLHEMKQLTDQLRNAFGNSN